MRYLFCSFCTTLLLSIIGMMFANIVRAQEPQKIALWPDVPARTGSIYIHVPEKPNGTAMVICPGGGYGGLVTGAEGHGIAKWLNGNGITGIVLEYELPKGRATVPLEDAQQSIRLARFNAKRWKIDENKIGIIGFSAGGHLASTAGTHFDLGNETAEDELEQTSCRPNFMVLVYPVITMGERTHGGSKRNLLGKEPTAENERLFSNELQVTRNTPPAYIAHAKDDIVVPPEHSQMFRDALTAKGVAVEYLELPSGGHGLNGYKGANWDAWQVGALRWLTAQGFLRQQTE